MNEVLIIFWNKIQEMIVTANMKNIIDFFSFLISIVALGYSRCAMKRSRWEAASNFLLQVDSEDMRAARKTVYAYYEIKKREDEKKESGRISDIEKDDRITEEEFDKAVTYVIAFYDGNAKLALNGYLPIELFEDTTLITATRFYNTVYDYIDKRRKKEIGHNEIHALNYTKLLADRRVRRKIGKLLASVVGNEKIFNVAYETTKRVVPKNIVTHDVYEENRIIEEYENKEITGD